MIQKERFNSKFWHSNMEFKPYNCVFKNCGLLFSNFQKLNIKYQIQYLKEISID